MSGDFNRHRRRAIVALGAVVVAAPLSALSQQSKYRIGYLANDPDRSSPTFQAFLTRMQALGWSEGTNLEILYLSSNGRDELFPSLAVKAVQAKVDLIVATGSASTKAAIASTRTIPIVFGSATNPVEQKFVASLARPGGNVTGLALLVQELGPKRLQLLKGLLPQGSRFARLYQSTSISTLQPAIMSHDDEAARALGVSLQHLAVRTVEDIDKVLAAAARDKIEGLVVTAAAVFVVNRDLLAKLAVKHRMPMICADARFCAAGALASYGEDFASRYRRAAALVDKILRGAKPADLPVEQPTIFELVLNLQTAKLLDLTIPPNFIIQADRLVNP